jgi:hypothetical protein
MNAENHKKHLEISEHCKNEEHKSTTPHWIYDSFYTFFKKFISYFLRRSLQQKKNLFYNEQLSMEFELIFIDICHFSTFFVGK